MSERRTHWLKTSSASRFPRRIVTFDSEAHVAYSGRAERHRFRLAVAAADQLDPETRAPVRTDWCETTDAAELWAFVDGWTRSNERTVVFAHNLGYDLRIAQALQLLPELGWEMRAWSLDSYRCFMRWRKGKRGLTMVDTSSFYPVSLDTIARCLRMRKLPLPDQQAGVDAWLQRCRRDVEITRAAVLRLLDYLEREQMGSFRLTGPAQASAALRSRFLADKALLVHDHSPAIDAERESAYTGRCEAWRHGRQAGWVYEWDERLSYAHLARRLYVPTRLVGHKYDLQVDDLRRLRGNYALLCDVEIATEVPVAPTRHEGRIVWPVGRFRSQLWDLELDLVDLYDQPYRVRHAFLYERAPALHEWADWIIAQLDGDEPEPDPLQRHLLKAWSRSLIGRFGLRYPQLQKVATAPTNDVSYLPHLDDESGATRYTLQVGREVLEQQGAVEGRDAMPAIMAYIMAAGRRRLWTIMQSAGIEDVLYVDTDSILVNARAHARLLAATERGTLDNLRYKQRLSKVEIIGPRMVVSRDDVKIAGLPKGARKVSAQRWSAEFWESAKTGLQRGRSETVVVERRTYQIRSGDHRRRHRAAGLTIPYRIDTLEP